MGSRGPGPRGLPACFPGAPPRRAGGPAGDALRSSVLSPEDSQAKAGESERPTERDGEGGRERGAPKGARGALTPGEVWCLVAGVLGRAPGSSPRRRACAPGSGRLGLRGVPGGMRSPQESAGGSASAPTGVRRLLAGAEELPPGRGRGMPRLKPVSTARRTSWDPAPAPTPPVRSAGSVPSAPFEFDPDTRSSESPHPNPLRRRCSRPALAPPGARCFRGVREAFPGPRQPRVSPAGGL